jgi:hypothetical protein
VPLRITIAIADGGALPADQRPYLTLTLADGRTVYPRSGNATDGYTVLLPAPCAFTVRADVGGLLTATADGELAAGAMGGEVALALPPSGSLVVRVTGADGAPVEGAQVGAYPAGLGFLPGYNSTDAEGRATLAPVAFGRVAVSASLSGPAALAEADFAADGQEVALTVAQPGSVVALPPEGVTSGYASLYFRDELGEYSENQSLVNGRFTFARVRPGEVTVVLQDVAQAASGRVEAGAELRLQLPAAAGKGTVYGRGWDGDEATPLADRRLTVLGSTQVPYAPIAGTTQQGRYLARNVPAGGALVLDEMLRIGAAGSVAPFASTRVDLPARAQAASRLPVTLNGRGVQVQGALSGGPFGYEPNLRVNGVYYPGAAGGLLTDGGAGVELGALPVAGARVARRIYAPAQAPWVRFAEVVENPGDAPLVVDLWVQSNQSRPAVATSSGAVPASVADRWAASAGQGGLAALGFVFGGTSGGDGPQTVSFDAAGGAVYGYRYGWRVTLQPGERAAYLHYLVDGTALSADELARTAASLAALTAPGAIEGLDADVLGIVRNFPPATMVVPFASSSDGAVIAVPSSAEREPAGA